MFSHSGWDFLVFIFVNGYVQRQARLVRLVGRRLLRLALKFLQMLCLKLSEKKPGNLKEWTLVFQHVCCHWQRRATQVRTYGYNSMLIVSWLKLFWYLLLIRFARRVSNVSNFECYVIPVQNRLATFYVLFRVLMVLAVMRLFFLCFSQCKGQYQSLRLD